MKSLRKKTLVVSLALVAALAVGLVGSNASRGKATRSAGLRPDANTIGGWRIKNDTLPQWKIVPGGIGHSRIGNNAIQANNIAAGAVTTNAIADGAVTTNQIADGSVTVAKLDAAFVSSLFVVDPASTQIVHYGGTNVGTILRMAAGATANPFEIQTSSSSDVFSVGPNGSFMSDAGAIYSNGSGDLSVGGSLSTDGGSIATDGLGDLTVGGSLTTDGGAISSDGAGNLTVNGELTSNSTIYGEGSTDGHGNALVLGGGGLAVDTPNYAGNFVDLGNGLFTVDSSGNLTTHGWFSTDNNAIYSDGTGDLTVEGNLGVGGDTTVTTLESSGLATLDSLAVTNAASIGGNLTVGPNFAVTASNGSIWADGGLFTSDGSGNVTAHSLTLDPAWKAINVNGDSFDVYSDGHFIADAGAIASDGSGNLTIAGIYRGQGINIHNGTFTVDFGGNVNSFGYAHFTGADHFGYVLDLHNGRFTVRRYDGAFRADSGGIYSDGIGDLTVVGTLTANLVNTVNLNVSGYENISGADANGESLNVTGGGININSPGDINCSFLSSGACDSFSVGNLNSPNFAIGTDGSFGADGGFIFSDGSGDLTVQGFTANGTASFWGDAHFYNGLYAGSSDQLAIDTSGNLDTSGNGTFDGNLTVGGSFSTDGGNITTDGSGNLDISTAGSLCVGGCLFEVYGSDGSFHSGNAAINGTLEVNSTNSSAFDVNSGEFTVNGSNGAFLADGGSIYSDGAGNLTVVSISATGPSHFYGGLYAGSADQFHVDASGNITTTGTATINAASGVALTVRGAAGQDIARFKDSGGTTQMLVDSAGDLVVGTKFSITNSNGHIWADNGAFTTDGSGNTHVYTLTVSSTANSTVFSAGGDTINGSNGNLSVAGTTASSGNLTVGSKFAVTASSGAVSAANGAFTTDGSGNTTVNTLVVSSSANSNAIQVNTNMFTVNGSNGNTSIAGTLGVGGATNINSSGADIGNVAALNVRGSSNGLLPDIADFRTSAGTIVDRFDSIGTLYAVGGQFNAQATGNVGLDVRGSSTGTPNIAEFRKSDNTLEVWVDYTGKLNTAGGMAVAGDLTVGSKFTVTASNGSISADNGGFTTDGSGNVAAKSGSFNPGAANTVALTVQGSANAGNPDVVDFKISTGVTKVSVDSSGLLTASAGVSASTLTVTSTANSTVFSAGGDTINGLTGDLSIAGVTASAGNLTVGSKFTVTASNGSISADNGGFTTDGSGNVAAKSGSFNPAAANTVALTAQGSANAANPDVVDFKISTGVTKVSVDATGLLTASAGLSASTVASTGNLTVGTKFTVTASNGSISADNGAFTTDGSGNVSAKSGVFNPGAANTVALTAQGSSNAANPDVVDFKISTGVTKVSVDSTGLLTASAGVSASTLTVTSTANSTVFSAGGDTINGLTGDLSIAGVTASAGNLTVGSKFTVTASNGSISADNGAFTTDGSGNVSAKSGVFNPGAANTIALTAQGSSNAANPDVVDFKISTGVTKVSVDSTGLLTASAGVSASTLTVSSVAAGTVFSAGGTTIKGSTGDLSVAGATASAGDLTVGTKFTVTASTGAVSAAAGTFVVDGSGNLTVVGITESGDLNIGTGKFTVQASTGNTAISGTLGVTGLTTVANFRVTGKVIFTATPATVDATLNPTLTATNLLTNKIIKIIQSAGVGTVTTDTAANIVAALPGTPAVGDTFVFTLYNTTGGVQAITGGTNVTLVGGASIANGKVAQFECNVTNVTGGSEAVTCYQIGG